MYTITITGITVVNTGGPDHIFLTTTLPNPIYPFEGSATIKLDSAPTKTKKFLKDYFPNIKYKHIKVPHL